MIIKGDSLWQQYLAQLKADVHLIGPLATHLSVESAPVIYVDGGSRLRKFPDSGISVGDGDSSCVEPQVLLNREKDLSDLAFVLRSLPSTVKNLRLQGFLGGAKDHELMNFGEAFRFLGSSPMRRLVMDDEVIGLSAGQWTENIVGVFSLITLAPMQIQLTGKAKYRLDTPTRIEVLESLGLSNVGFGQISIFSTGPLFLLKRP